MTLFSALLYEDVYLRIFISCNFDILRQVTGMVDKRTLEKYEKEAKEKNRETWYLSWALDTNSEVSISSRKYIK